MLNSCFLPTVGCVLLVDCVENELFHSLGIIISPCPHFVVKQRTKHTTHRHTPLATFKKLSLLDSLTPFGLVMTMETLPLSLAACVI